jgi:hypothetical protein
MSIAEKVKTTLAEKITDISKDKEFIKLRDFYEEKQREGIAQKQPYSLPPLDTVGRRLRQGVANKTTR